MALLLHLAAFTLLQIHRVPEPQRWGNDTEYPCLEGLVCVLMVLPHPGLWRIPTEGINLKPSDFALC